MLGKIFNTFFPMREFLNYLFKKTLGDYILNDLDLNKIEIEISNKAFISLKNIDLNAADINKKHLENLPFLMLEGQLKKFDLSFSMDKISINIDKLNILLMPIFNKEKTKNLIAKKQIPVKINESVITNNDENSGQKNFSSYTKENTNNEFSLVSSFLNSALSNLEINITNISVSILSHEASNTFQENPILTFFISEICFRKKNDEDVSLVNDNKNFQNLNCYGNNINNNNKSNHNNNLTGNGSNNKKSSKNFNNLKNENASDNNFPQTDNSNKSDSNNMDNSCKNASFSNGNENNPNNNLNQLTFLSNKILLIDKIILRIHQQNQNIENEFFEMTNENEEKINFNFFCNNSSILVFDYKSTGYSVLVDFAEALDLKNKHNEAACNLMDINVDLRKLEICVNPLQMQILINYFDVFNMISMLKEKDLRDNCSFKSPNGDKIKNNIKVLKPLKVLKTVLSRFSLNLFFEGVNLIVLETNYMKDIPKLWSFFQENYNKKIENIHALESHYSYMEDNFFLVHLAKFKFNFTQEFTYNKENFEFSLEKVFMKYIEFLGKKKIIPSNNITHCKLTFNNYNSNFLAKSTLNENLSNSINFSNNLNNSKILFNSQLHKSKNFFNNNNSINNSKLINFNINNFNNNNVINQGNPNNTIYTSNIFYMDKSMNRSSCSIYESVRDYDEAYNSDNSIIKNSLNNTIYQSTLESKDALLERYNLIFESEYLHESHVILELTNNSIADNCCISIKSYKDYFKLKKGNNQNNNNFVISQQETLILNNENNSNSDYENAVDAAEKNSTLNFADYSKQFIEILLKKISVEFNPLYLYKITKLVYFTQVILNEFLYLIDNNCNNLNGNSAEDSNEKHNDLLKIKSFKSDSKISPFKNRKGSENSVSFIDKSVFKEDQDDNLDTKFFNNEENVTGKAQKTIYFRGCYEKSKQILLNFEEINLKIQTLKKDFYDTTGKCMTSSNTNLTEEFKKYEEYPGFLSNSEFLSQFIIEYYKANVNPFIANFEKNEFTKSLIGKKQEIKLDKQMNFYKINKEYLEINLSNHRILLNFKNEKVDKLLNNSNYNNLSTNFKLKTEIQIPDSVSYVNSLNKILYDFDLIQINFGAYNILKLKRDMICFRNSINNSSSAAVDELNKNNINQRKIFEFENSYCEKSDNLKRNSVYHVSKNTNDMEQMTSKNNLHFRLSPIVINQKKTNYQQDADEEEINSAFKKEFWKADEKINAKIESLFNSHDLNLIQNFDFDNANNNNKNANEDNKDKENEGLFGNKIIEKMELNVNLVEDIYLTLEPQIIKKIIPFFDSLLFSVNIHKMIAKKQKQLFEFYKEIYFVSLNIDNFKDFGFYYRSKNKNDLNDDAEKEETSSNKSKEDDEASVNLNSENTNNKIKFSAISLILKNINLYVLRNNSDDYIGSRYKNSDYTNYLLKVSLLNPFMNIISKGAGNSNILVSLNDLKIAIFKNKNDYFENSNNSPISLYSFSELDKEFDKDDKFVKEIAYEENLILYKGDYLYKNILNSNHSNEKGDTEKDLEKYFKSNKTKNILTLVVKFRETAKNNILEKIKKQNSLKSVKNNCSEINENFLNKNNLDIKEIKIQNFNDNFIYNFKTLVENNLMPQSDTSLDIIIISNDAVLSPLTYPNFNFEEIKLIAKEFGIDKEANKPLSELSKLKTLDVKLNEQINDLLLQTTKTQQGSFSIQEFNKSEFRLDIRESASKFEINMQNNLENLIRNEEILNHENDLISRIKAEKEKAKGYKEEVKEKEKICSERSQKLINLFSQSNLNIDFNIEINRLSIEAFIENENNKNNNNKNTNSNGDQNNRKLESINQIEDQKTTERNKRKKKIRTVIHIEKITHFKEIDLFSKKNSNITKRNLTIINLNIYLLKNLNHPYAELNILKLNNGRYQEDSIFKYLGFVELLSLNSIKLSFTREIAFQYFSDSKSASKNDKNEILIPKVFNDIAVKLGDISVFTCKDTLDACIEIAEALKTKANKLNDLIDSGENEESKINNDIVNEQEIIKEIKDSAKEIQLLLDKKAEANEDEKASKIRNNFEIHKNKENNIGMNLNKIIEVPAEENYFEKNNLKNVIFLDDYCNSSSKSHLKDFDSEYEKLGYDVKNYSIHIDNDRNSILDNKMSFDLNSNNNNKERKEETIIFFDLESLKLYIYKGSDFDFVEEKDLGKMNIVNRDLIAKNKLIKNSEKEKKLSNDEILIILSNSLYVSDGNKNEARETFNFLYDKQNNSIKIDENFLNRNSLCINKNTNQSNLQVNHNDFNNNLINNSNNRQEQILNMNKISTLVNNNLKINPSIYPKAISDSLTSKNENSNLGFNVIERFYFCDGGEAKYKKRTNSITGQNESSNKYNAKNNLNYLEFEKKLMGKKQNQRDYNNHICINLECLKTKFTFFRNNEKISMNIYINRFDIEDYVKNSKYKKIISKYVFENFDNMEIYENSKNSKKINKYKYKEDRPLLDFDIDIVKINESFKFEDVKKNSCEAAETGEIFSQKIRKNSDYKIEENVIIAINKEDNVDNIDILDLKNKNKKLENDLIHVDGYISPINILLDQATLVFIVEFFLVKDFNNVNNNKNEHATEMNTNASGINNQKRNLDYKKIKDPLEIKINVEKLKSNGSDNRGKIKLKESMGQDHVTKPIRTEYNSTNSTYSVTDSNLGVETFSFNEENTSEVDLHKKKTFLKNAKISEFFILFSYNAHSISFSKLTNKEYLELLNFSNISELKIDFKRYDYKGFLPIEDFPKNLINFWINDLKKEKTKILSSVINSVGFIKPFTTMMSGFFNMIVLPYKNYVQDKSLTNGLFGEFKNFVLKFTSQSLFLGEKTFLVIKKIISGAENTNLDKNSYYKKFLYMIDDEKKKYEEYYYK